MTFKNFFILTFVQWLLFLLLKLAYLKWGIFGDSWISDLLYFLSLAVVAAAVCRRFGVINYLEALFLMIFWFILNGVLDLLVTAFMVGIKMFLSWQLWVGYFIIMFVILTFHKKRHVVIRHEQKHHH